MPPDAEPPERPPRRGRWQFSVASLLLVTALVSILAAGLGGMLRAAAGETRTPAHYFVLLTIAAPVGALVLISLLRLVAQFLRRRD